MRRLGLGSLAISSDICQVLAEIRQIHALLFHCEKRIQTASNPPEQSLKTGNSGRRWLRWNIVWEVCMHRMWGGLPWFYSCRCALRLQSGQQTSVNKKCRKIALGLKN